MYKTISEVRAANKAAGNFFFDRGTMRFFKSRIHGGLRDGRFFITSEQDDNGPRLYSIREVKPGGRIDTVGGFGDYRHLEDTRDAVDRLAPRRRATHHSRTR